MTSEADQPNQGRGRGRPRMPDEDKKRHSITFRMRTELRAKIAEKAAVNGCSISEEIERTIEGYQSLSNIIQQKDFIIDDLRDNISKKTAIIKMYSDLCDSIKNQNRTTIAMIERFVRNAIENSPSNEEINIKFGTKEEAESVLLSVKSFMGIGTSSDDSKG